MLDNVRGNHKIKAVWIDARHRLGIDLFREGDSVRTEVFCQLIAIPDVTIETCCIFWNRKRARTRSDLDALPADKKMGEGAPDDSNLLRTFSLLHLSPILMQDRASEREIRLIESFPKRLGLVLSFHNLARE